MHSGTSASVTELIHRSRDGDAAARESLFAAVYPDLRRLARARLRAGRRNTYLDTGALIHEAYLRFAASAPRLLEDRVHFMRWAACAMRSVIVDMARRRIAARRGGGGVSADADADAAVPNPIEDIVRVHEALARVRGLDPRLAMVVEMRYFAGFREMEIAAALGVTERTVRRDWDKARLLLREALG